MTELNKILSEAVKAGAIPGQYECKYCNRSFTKESTLQVHMCEPKRRAEQKNDKGVQIGYQAWLRFYEITQGSAKLKTYEDFTSSSFYNAFVKFGRHCVNINVINVTQFTEHVLRNRIRIDHWCRDQVYDAYLMQLLRTEASTDAAERAILTMQKWAEEKTDAGEQVHYYEYFHKCSTNRFIQHIQNGRVSPWAIYCSSSGIDKMDSLSEEQVSLVMPVIDPEFWDKKLRDYPADAELIRTIMEQAGV
jgi:hypothetical protein